eukprot:TRINITY_DN16087_c0_g1_i1.p1 TRINITY_DN16087_c0_g1~~TRINITY_DN16087_c0_g1_i1.p1  ORF type:complete len:143 (+),score=18.99 TRINITY_DN16087_c0_g1_i1:76-504(+)
MSISIKLNVPTGPAESDVPMPSFGVVEKHANPLFMPLEGIKFQSNMQTLRECDQGCLHEFLGEVASILLGEPERTAGTAFVGGRLSCRSRKFLITRLRMTLACVLRGYANDFFFDENSGTIHVTYLHSTLHNSWDMSFDIAV